MDHTRGRTTPQPTARNHTATNTAHTHTMLHLASEAKDPAPAPTPPRRLRALCLHGGGASNRVMQFQTIRLRKALPEFDFHFLEGAIEYDPRHVDAGVLQFFGDDKPYYGWYVVRWR